MHGTFYMSKVESGAVARCHEEGGCEQRRRAGGNRLPERDGTLSHVARQGAPRRERPQPARDMWLPAIEWLYSERVKSSLAVCMLWARKHLGQARQDADGTPLSDAGGSRGGRLWFVRRPELNVSERERPPHGVSRTRLFRHSRSATSTWSTRTKSLMSLPLDARAGGCDPHGASRPVGAHVAADARPQSLRIPHGAARPLGAHSRCRRSDLSGCGSLSALPDLSALTSLKQCKAPESSRAARSSPLEQRQSQPPLGQRQQFARFPACEFKALL